MKRRICFLLSILILIWPFLLALGGLSVSADDTVPLTFSSEDVDFSCRFDAETSKIYLGGQIRHDVFVTHSDYTIEVYAVSPGEDAQTIINDPAVAPIAHAAIAITFEFVLDAKDILAKYSRYCVVLRSSDGQHLLASEPRFAEVASEFVEETAEHVAYKGIATSLASAAANAGAGRMILPIYFDRLISPSSSGYVYPMAGGNLYFDKLYIEALDVALRSATVAGTQVYLQYLVSESAMETFPDVYDTEILAKVEAITSFLCERYENVQSGIFSGIIVGKTVDHAMASSAAAGMSLHECSERYALYVIAVANAARRLHAGMDIVLPFSSVNSYSNALQNETSPSALLERILGVFDRGFSERFACTAMIESDTVPVEYPSGWEKYKAPITPVNNDATIHAGNVAIYAQYLNVLRTQYASAPVSFMFVWNVPSALSGNALCAAYGYSYFRLLAQEGLSSFVVSFTAREHAGNMHGFSELSHCYTYADTKECLSAFKPFLRYFQEQSWDAVCKNTYQPSYALRTFYEAPASFALNENVKGRFSYFDFSTSVNLNHWFFGNACQGIRLNYHDVGGKALQLKMKGATDGYAEAFCLYEYPENLVYTPYVAFRMEIDTTSVGSLYEITVMSGTGRTRVIGKTAVSAGEPVTLVLDLSEYSASHLSDYWKIGVRPLSGDTADYSLWIYDIVGYSTEWNDAELASLIEAERLRIRNLENPNVDEGAGYERLWMILGIVAVIVMIGVGMFIFLRPTDENGHETHNERDNG